MALVSTLSSLSPAPPFLFRTYQLPPGSKPLAAQIGAHAGKPCMTGSCATAAVHLMHAGDRDFGPRLPLMLHPSLPSAGSCKHPVWQAVRASSAASFYLEVSGRAVQADGVRLGEPWLVCSPSQIRPQ